MPQDQLPSPNHKLLMHLTAEMLAMPELVCGHRQCRRRHACSFHRRDTLEPTCLSHLWPGDRALFDQLFAIVRGIHDGTRYSRPSEDAERHELEEAAIAIVHASLPLMPEIAAQFGRWCQRYYAPPAPPVDTGKLLADVRAELAHDKMLLEMAELRGGRQSLDP